MFIRTATGGRAHLARLSGWLRFTPVNRAWNRRSDDPRAPDGAGSPSCGGRCDSRSASLRSEAHGDAQPLPRHRSDEHDHRPDVSAVVAAVSQDRGSRDRSGLSVECQSSMSLVADSAQFASHAESTTQAGGRHCTRMTRKPVAEGHLTAYPGGQGRYSDSAREGHQGDVTSRVLPALHSAQGAEHSAMNLSTVGPYTSSGCSNPCR
jgi:hypothetical protein